MGLGVASDPGESIRPPRPLAPRTRAAHGGHDFDEIDDPAHALDLGDDRLGHLFQVVAGEAAAKPQGPRAGVARDVPQRRVTAAPETALSLEADPLLTG